MQIDGEREMLDTKTDSTLSAGVYPYWHPGGKYIAYSVNNTRQSFHAVKDERTEVFDLASDVLVYCPGTHELLLSPLLQKKDVFETFPAFSPDGRKLYNWSSNSRWFVFSSRRGDGLYTRLYLASLDENGVVGKPFLLPQENPREYYDRLIYSYNVPDFASEPLKLERRKVERSIVSRKRIPVRVRQ